MNKKLLTVLGISLAVNFMFIGFETAKIIRQPAFPDIPPERPQFIRPDAFRPDAPDLQNKKLMRDAFKQAVRNHRQEMDDARKAVEETLKTDPFDAEKFKAAMQKAAAVRSTVDTAVQENMAEMLLKMTPEERQRFADRFAQKAAPDFQPPHKRPDGCAAGRRGRPHRPENGFAPDEKDAPFAPPCARENAPVPCVGDKDRRPPCGQKFNRHKAPAPCECAKNNARKMKRPQPAEINPAE